MWSQRHSRPARGAGEAQQAGRELQQSPNNNSNNNNRTPSPTHKQSANSSRTDGLSERCHHARGFENRPPVNGLGDQICNPRRCNVSEQPCESNVAPPGQGRKQLVHDGTCPGWPSPPTSAHLKRTRSVAICRLDEHCGVLDEASTTLAQQIVRGLVRMLTCQWPTQCTAPFPLSNITTPPPLQHPQLRPASLPTFVHSLFVSVKMGRSLAGNST